MLIIENNDNQQTSFFQNSQEDLFNQHEMDLFF